MDRIWKSGASGTPPVAPAVPSVGYPTQGNSVAGVPATTPGAWWFHMITEELRNVIVAAGLAPDGSQTNQLLSAVLALSISPDELEARLARTWQDVSASRVHSVAYQNTTTKEIFVMIRGTSTSGDGRTIQISPDGATWRQIGSVGQEGDGEGSGFPVPVGWYYRVVGAISAGYVWEELR